MSSGQRPKYAEKTSDTCPRCASSSVTALPANNPGSEQEWFRCAACDHMWSHRRDRTEQGDSREPGSADPPEGEDAEEMDFS